MCMILSESFVPRGDYRSIYRSAANIAVDIPIENDIHPGVLVLEKCALVV